MKSKSVPIQEVKKDDPKAKLKETDPKTELKEADVKPEAKIEQKETLDTPKGTKELKIEL